MAIVLQFDILDVIILQCVSKIKELPTLTDFISDQIWSNLSKAKLILKTNSKFPSETKVIT